LILAVALVGIAVNLTATWTLAKANGQSLNVEGSLKHILTDLYAFIGTAIAAGVIIATKFERADPLASLLVAGLMLRSAYAATRPRARIPRSSPRRPRPSGYCEVDGRPTSVVEVHDLRVWEVTSGFPALSAHVLVGRENNCHDARRVLEAMLHERFEIEHTTLKVDHEGSEQLATRGQRTGRIETP